MTRDRPITSHHGPLKQTERRVPLPTYIPFTFLHQSGMSKYDIPYSTNPVHTQVSRDDSTRLAPPQPAQDGIVCPVGMQKASLANEPVAWTMSVTTPSELMARDQ